MNRLQAATTLTNTVSPLDRQQAVTRLAIPLTEAAGVTEAEGRDDGR